ncbi:ribosomal protein S18 acetylase RimI-like enzyme [Isoptericola jiangsuensis]|uniref:Ribosomal protein S18 acetylase RimI-like enzyme n=1 Tax=Isoptericola jiangsuensis TaxID=548579 RepID=A0A2A9EVG0_9MICO|nr:GNAT family acetyltransferase [Isoptericola jiangsuensis]PFG42270.1 ribosomal protein S18 acetylase RimI-like enzyme [Isoptericola jiangsuensis]
MTGAPAAPTGTSAPAAAGDAVVIGEMRDADVEGVVALWEACDLTRAWNDPHRDVAAARRNPTSTVLVARDGDTVVGSAMAGYEGHRGWLYYVAVAPGRRGTGLGRQVVTAAEDWLHAAGAHKVRLMVRTTNTAVLGFYAGLGYTDAGCTVLGRDLSR